MKMLEKDAGAGELLLGIIMAAIGIAVQAAPFMRGKDWEAALFHRPSKKKGPGFPARRKKKGVLTLTLYYIKPSPPSYLHDKRRGFLHNKHIKTNILGTERTKKVWNECLKALEEERTNNGVRSLDNVTVSTITSHGSKPGSA